MPATALAPQAPMLPSPPPQALTPTKSILKTHAPTTPISASAKRKRPSDWSSPDSGTDSGSGSAQEDEGEPVQMERKKRRVKFDLSGSGGGSSKKKVSMETDGDRGEADALDAAVVREEVRRAIQRHYSGDSGGLDRIKALFAVDAKRGPGAGHAKEDEEEEEEADEEDGGAAEVPSGRLLRNHLLGLLANVSDLEAPCSGLVYAVLGSDWVGRDERYVRLYVKFLGTLVAARGGYLNAVLRMLANGLREIPPKAGRLSGYACVLPHELFARIHFALRYIINLIPAGSGALAPILAAAFPHEADGVRQHVAYTLNLMRIIDYAPELRSDILALVTERVIKIDALVDVDVEDVEELEEEEEEEEEEGGGEEDEDKEARELPSAEEVALAEDEPDGEDDSDSEGGSEDGETARLQVGRDHYRKIDYMLDILFSHYAGAFTGTTTSAATRQAAHDLLLAQFRTIILPTYRSRFAQFLLFRFSQSSPTLVDRFAAVCADIALSRRTPPILRTYAAAYLASFVARGKRVSARVVQDVYELLGAHLVELTDEYGGGATAPAPDLRRYEPFYAVTQALMYIFCFRWRDLTTAAWAATATAEAEAAGGGTMGEADADANAAMNPDPDRDDDPNRDDPDPDDADVDFPLGVREVLRAGIYSRLNPLKVCAPAVVGEFARVARRLRLLYVYPLLERNRRGLAVGAEGGSGSGNGSGKGRGKGVLARLIAAGAAGAAGSAGMSKELMMMMNNDGYKGYGSYTTNTTSTRQAQTPYIAATPDAGALPGAGARGAAGGPRGVGAGLQLDAYFPFDPYRLRRSARWVAAADYYVEWRGLPGEVDDGGGDGDDGDDGDDDGEMEDGMML